MKEGYKFVYSLLHNGNVFYIGCTKNVKSRYKQHLTLSSIASGPKLRKYMRELLNEGKYPDLNIIAYLPTDDALRLEDKIIAHFSLAGHEIVNDRSINTNGKQRPKGMPDNPNLKQQLKAIQYKMDMWLHRMSQPHSPWKPYPTSPFERI